MDNSDSTRTKLSLIGALSGKQLQLEAEMLAPDGQFADIALSTSTNISFSPPFLSLDPSSQMFGELIMEGNLEEIFHFINLGNHRFEGLISARLLMNGTPSSPVFKGNLHWSQGKYRNEMTGTSLKNIEACFHTEKKMLILDQLQANDEQGGSLLAKGELAMDIKDNFPFTLDASLDNLCFLQFDFISANFSGPLAISGNAHSATAKGALHVDEATLFIPEKLPVDIPQLDVTLLNMPPECVQGLLSPSFYPLHYDLQLGAPQKVFVRGRGLNSEWKGNVHLRGTNLNLNAEGQLHLVKGEFSFSGKNFELTQGEIAISDQPSQNAYLNLSGTLSLEDLTVLALLRGPFRSPQLTFQSIPSLPTSSLLSRILFNKDISEISPFQALHLAQTLVSLAGGAAPDLLEKIRTTLGVDRLNIVSAPNGSDQVNIQIGMYLTEGVLVTLSQGIDSNQVIVEVELGKGFVFQAETQEEEEGKFILKWKKNY